MIKRWKLIDTNNTSLREITVDYSSGTVIDRYAHSKTNSIDDAHETIMYWMLSQLEGRFELLGLRVIADEWT